MSYVGSPDYATAHPRYAQTPLEESFGQRCGPVTACAKLLEVGPSAHPPLFGAIKN
jgi:hypothetical protein